MNPFLSIVIPTLNEEKYLPLLLHDLAQQTSKNFEVIVVDGNSKDKTVQKADEFRKKLALLIKKVARQNVSYQKNTGVRLAKGDYVLILDADTQLDTGFVKTVIYAVQQERARVYLPIILPLSTKFIYKVTFKISNFLVRVSQNWPRPLPTQAAMLFKRDFLISLGGYKEHSSQDKKKFYPDEHEIIHRVRNTGTKAIVLRDVYIKVSQRRFYKNGELKTFITYGLSAIYMTLFGRTSNTNIDYEMGGQVYDHK